MLFDHCLKICLGNDEKDRRNLIVQSKMDEIETKIHLHARRRTIYDRIDLDGFKAPSYPKSKVQMLFLLKALENFVFIELDEDEKRIFCEAMQEETVKEKELIIKQGDEGDFFYILAEGIVEFVDKEEVVGECKPGGAFGELALLYNSPRAVSCVAKSKCRLWKLDRHTFRYLIAKHASEKGSKMIDMLRNVELFRTLDEAHLVRLADSMTQVKWNKNEQIIRKGAMGHVFYIVKEGRVKVHDIGLGDSHYDDQILGPGSCFGERSLLTGELRAANVTALTETVTFAIERGVFEECLGPLKCLLDTEMRKQAIKSIPIFANSDVSDPEIEHLAPLLNEVCYRKGSKLSESGRPYEEKLWIVRHGRLLVYRENSDTIYTLDSGDFYGDKSVQSKNHIAHHTAIVEEDLTVWEVTREQIEDVIGDIHRLGGTASFEKRKSASSIPFDDLVKHKVLGEGGFGKVYLVSIRNNKSTAYALKQMIKSEILKSKQEEGVIREKEILALLRHPFIISLHASYQDADNLYLLLPLVPGGELFSVLQKQQRKPRGLEPKKAFFYLACIIEALGHFHQRRIAYRDLKLENVLIDEDGYCKIVDLGFAKVVIEKTFTLCGTPEYLAPEILLSKGHDRAVDIWAYGILVYELLSGQTPFYAKGSTQTQMFRRIVMGKFSIPDYVHKSESELISAILIRNPSQRLGNLSRGHLDVKNHAAFQEKQIVFGELVRKKFPAPWKPTLTDPFDSSNFDAYYDHSFERGRHLTSKEQKVFENF